MEKKITHMNARLIEKINYHSNNVKLFFLVMFRRENKCSLFRILMSSTEIQTASSQMGTF